MEKWKLFNLCMRNWKLKDESRLACLRCLLFDLFIYLKCLRQKHTSTIQHSTNKLQPRTAYRRARHSFVKTKPNLLLNTLKINVWKSFHTTFLKATLA